MKKENVLSHQFTGLSEDELFNIQAGNPAIGIGIGIRMLWTVMEDPHGVVNGFLDAFN